MRRIVVLCATAVTAATAATGAAASAHAGVSCHEIDATGVGEGADAQPGDPPNVLRTTARISDGGLLQGTTSAAFTVTGQDGDDLLFEGPVTFTTTRATLTVRIAGTLDTTTGEFAAEGTDVTATGKLVGASGRLVFEGVQEPGPSGRFTETVTGSVCVDLGGNGRR